MKAQAMIEDYPVISLDAEAVTAAQLLATRRLPGLVVIDEQQRPHSVLGASQVVRFLVPSYIQDDPPLASVIDESVADQMANALAGHRVRDLLPSKPVELAVAAVDDTLIEVAAVMARMRSPLVAVVDNDKVIGVITASRLLQLALASH